MAYPSSTPVVRPRGQQTRLAWSVFANASGAGKAPDRFRVAPGRGGSALAGRGPWRRRAALLALLAAAGCGWRANAQTYSFQQIATSIPGPQTPSTDGRYVVFVDSNRALWSYDLKTQDLVKLADTNTVAPHGTGTFASFGQLGGGPYSGFADIVRAGTAIFLAQDQTGQGLYSVPASGGPLQLIANYDTTLPDGGQHGFYNIGLNDAGNVVWSNPVGGIYSARIDGSQLTTVESASGQFHDPNSSDSFFCNASSAAAAIGGNTVLFIGQPHPAIYAVPLGTNAGGAATCNASSPDGPLLWDYLSPLSGDPNTQSPLPDTSYVQSDGVNAYFWGFDFNDNNWGGGIFSVPLTGGAATKIVEVGDTLPSLGQVTALGTEFSVDNGAVAFFAYGSPNNKNGLFLYKGGTIQKLLVTGDSFPGATYNGQVFAVAPQSYTDGVITFTFQDRLFVATPPFRPLHIPPHRR